MVYGRDEAAPMRRGPRKGIATSRPRAARLSSPACPNPRPVSDPTHPPQPPRTGPRPAAAGEPAHPERTEQGRKTGRTGQSPQSPPSTRQTLTPEAWVDAATEVLVDHGIDHVRVDVLARQLGVTRGSFYWHFRDREDLLRSVLQAWRARATDQLTRRLSGPGRDAHAQLRDVISLPHRGRAAARAARIELAIRAWARRDRMAREAVDEADRQRIDYHRRIFEGLGFEPAEAALRGYATYGYEVAESIFHAQGDPHGLPQRSAFLERLMTSPLRPGEPAPEPTPEATPGPMPPAGAAGRTAAPRDT